MQQTADLKEWVRRTQAALETEEEITAGGASNTDTGGNLFFGLESRLGAAHPFFEVRGLLHDQSSVQLVGGLNFTLY